jgi:hypothetical protein
MSAAWFASAQTVPRPPAIVDPHPHHGKFAGVVGMLMIVPFLTGCLQSRTAMAETH